MMNLCSIYHDQPERGSDIAPSIAHTVLCKQAKCKKRPKKVEKTNLSVHIINEIGDAYYI